MIRVRVNSSMVWYLWLVLFVITPGQAVAQSSAAGTIAESRHSPEAVARFAKQVERSAAEHGARLFLVARKGRAQAELPEGIEYTHVGFGVYSSITLDDGRRVPGYAMYNLYQLDSDLGQSRLVVDFPVEFFADVFELQAALIIPTPELQTRLLDALASGVFEAMHNPRYSVISNPLDPRFQNCTEYILDVINAAIYRTTDVAELKAHAGKWFKPQKVKIGGLRLLLGGMFKKEVALSDHRGTVFTATFGSIRDYLDEHGLLDSAFELDAVDEEVRL